MITIKLVHVARSGLELEEFLKSLSYSHSGEPPYEVISDRILAAFEEKIKFVKEPSPNTRIIITLPDDCLVLGNAWNKYIKYALDNGLPQHGLGKNFVPTWEGYIQAKMGLQVRRPPEGVFPDLRVKFPVLCSKPDCGGY